ncbi:MAG: hypothetical protein KZQ83_20490 [gamma proteobacterium symbiont of Taylorina sp.]|nr:hypothetical protein [gamma proteobacterium symbiont of Taylorina sp.]
MQKNELILEDIYGEINDLLKPYKREHKLRERKINFINQCLREIDRDDFFSLAEGMQSKTAKDILDTDDLQEIEPFFEQLKVYANEKVDLYRVEFVEDFQALADDVELDLEIDFPRFSLLKGIEGEIDFAKRSTKINKKNIKTVDPKRIITFLQKTKRQYYDRKFDARDFIDNLYKTYGRILKELGFQSGEPIPIQTFYLQYVLSLQGKAFFQSMEKAKFKEYSVEQFAIDLWCYFDSDVSGTSANAKKQGKELKLRSGRNNSLWLIDRDGEKRQITGISFQ